MEAKSAPPEDPHFQDMKNLGPPYEANPFVRGARKRPKSKMAPSRGAPNGTPNGARSGAQIEARIGAQIGLKIGPPDPPPEATPI